MATKSITYDYNYYARPTLVGDGDIALISGTSYGNPFLLNLSEWQSLTGFDPHSKGSIKTVNTSDDIYFYYNETVSPKTITLTSNMIDMTGITYAAGTITLAPFTSIILLKDANP